VATAYDFACGICAPALPKAGPASVEANINGCRASVSSTSRPARNRSPRPGPIAARLLPASATMPMFRAASGLGHGRADDSQVIRAYCALNDKTGA
jgi:hypothetical protein